MKTISALPQGKQDFGPPLILSIQRIFNVLNVCCPGVGARAMRSMRVEP